MGLNPIYCNSSSLPLQSWVGLGREHKTCPAASIRDFRVPYIGSTFFLLGGSQTHRHNLCWGECFIGRVCIASRLLQDRRPLAATPPDGKTLLPFWALKPITSEWLYQRSLSVSCHPEFYTGWLPVKVVGSPTNWILRVTNTSHLHPHTPFTPLLLAITFGYLFKQLL